MHIGRGVCLYPALAGLLFTGLAAGAPGRAAAADVVQYNMAWLPQGSQAGIFVAMEKGYYAAESLEVKPVRGYGGIRTTNEIDQGLLGVGYGPPLGVILNRGKGGKTKLVGSINDKYPAGLCFVKERHTVRQPADLKGLTAGGGQGSPVQAMLPIWLQNNGLNPTDVKLMQLDPAVIGPSLIQGKIDLAECWLGSDRPVMESMARKANVTVDWVEYRRYGMDIYGNGVVTSEKVIKERPDLVRRFVRATYRGYEQAIRNPDEAADALQKHFPTLDRAITLQQVRETADLITGPHTPERGLGWVDAKKMERTRDFLATAYKITGTIALDDLFTNEFLPKR